MGLSVHWMLSTGLNIVHWMVNASEWYLLLDGIQLEDRSLDEELPSVLTSIERLLHWNRVYAQRLGTFIAECVY